jgi:glycolate oxidase iron-sulfur subunit
MHAAPEQRRFLDCVHCGLCLSSCPTYVELGTEMDSPRGRIYLMRGLAEGRLEPTAEVVGHLDGCLGCRACETACPSGVHYGELIESTRAHLHAAPSRPRHKTLLSRGVLAVFPYPERLRALLAPLRLLQRTPLWPLVRRLVPQAALLPRLQLAQPILAETPARGPQRACVGLLTGCVNQVLFAATNAATVRVLARNGCRVVAPPEQGCCGALHLHAGDRERARELARGVIAVFPDDLDAVLVNAAGCGAAMKEYGELLADDPAWAERARGFAVKVKDVNEYLATHELRPPRAPVRARVTYHDACHLAHAQGVRRQPRALLRSIPGLDLVELEEADHCCGSAGSYNLTEAAMARRLGERKARNIRATGAACAVAANPGCALQISAQLARLGAPIEVLHPIELLDRAYRAGGEYEETR